MILHTVLGKLFKARRKGAEERKGAGADPGFDPAEMPFLDHLEDLRKMFFKIIVAILLGLVFAFVFKVQLVEAMKYPIIWADVGNPDAIPGVFNKSKEPALRFEAGDLVKTDGGLIATVIEEDLKEKTTKLQLLEGKTLVRTDSIVDSIKAADIDPEVSDMNQFRAERLLIMETFQPQEGLMIVLKIAFFGGLIVSLPFVVWFIVEFALPGLRQNEKKVMYPALVVGFFLFLTGAAFAFCLGIPFALSFLAEWTIEHGMSPGWRISYYITFVTRVTLVFGIAFELPVVVLALVKMEILTYRTMRDSRSYAIVIIMVLSAFLTPPDPMTLILLSGPLILLYEFSIWMAYFIERKRLKVEAEEDRKRAEERAKRMEKQKQLVAAEGEEMSEEEKASAAADDIAKYEAEHGELDPEHYESNQDAQPMNHDESYQHDEHTMGHEHDPHHDDHHHGGGHFDIIDINNASVEELTQLPGVGPKLAERIIEARPFYSEDELEYHAHLPQSVIKLILDRIYYG